MWGAAAHLFEAFKPLSPPHNPPAAAASSPPTPKLPRTPSGLQRGESGLSLVGPKKGAKGTSPLATKLLPQDSLAKGNLC